MLNHADACAGVHGPRLATIHEGIQAPVQVPRDDRKDMTSTSVTFDDIVRHI